MRKKNIKKTFFEEQLEAEAKEEEAPEPQEPAGEQENSNSAEGASETDVDDAQKSDIADIQALVEERDQLKDQLLRARAEFDNFRKRSARDNERIRKTAAEALVRDLLPVMDHLELALKHADRASLAMAEGVEMVTRQFAEVLSKHGVEPIPSVGEVFDPNVHEAMMQRPDEEAAPNTVVEEFQRGYRMGDLVLRPAKVVVCSGPADNAEVISEKEEE
jgi:molecular chaperone GrpE